MTTNPQTFSLTITGNITAPISPVTISAEGHEGNAEESNSFTLNPAPAPPATKLHVVTSPTSQTAGASFTITVTAQDASSNTATIFHGDATLTATMNGMSVPLPQATLTNGVANVAASLSTTGTWTITAASNGLTPGTTTITITPGPVATIQIEAPSPVNAGDSFPITVTVRDAMGNLETSGVVTLTSTDPRVPSLGTVTIGNGGMGTLSGASLQTVGSQTITGTEGAISGAGHVQVLAGQATHLTVLATSPETAGSSFNVTIIAQDPFGNTVTGYNQAVNLSSTDTTATGMGAITLTNGTTTVSTTHRTAGGQVITATAGPAGMTISGSADVLIVAAAATHFLVSAPAMTTAGATFSFTVTAKDQFNNTATGYSGTVHFAGSDSLASLPASTTLSQGVGSFFATLKTAGNQTITATDAITSSITGTSNAIVVSAAALDHFSVTAPTTITAGTSFNVTAVARDVYGNTVTSYTGPATVTSTDGHAVLPSTEMFMSGTASFAATLNTVGNQSITVTDHTDTTKTGTAQITVNSTAVTKIVITGMPLTGITGMQFTFTVTAEDSLGNVVPTYSGTLHFTSSDPNAVKPPDSTLTNGTGTFMATLKTVGSQTLTATDTANAMVTGTSNGIAVTPGPVTHFQIVVPGTVTAGQQFSFVVAAKDQFENTVTSYTGPVTITSADPNLQIIQQPSFVNGLSTNGMVILKSAGLRTLTVTDPTTMVSTTSSLIQVIPGPPDAIYVVSGNSMGLAPNNPPVTINDAFPNPLVVIVSDQYGNPINGQAVTFSGPSTGASAALSPSTVNTGSNGRASVNATANQVAGAYAVTASIDSSAQPPPTTPQVQFTLTNLPGPAAAIQATSGTPQTAQVGMQFALPLVITVTDFAGNGVPGVTVTFSVPAQSGPSATLTPAGPYTTNAAGKVTVTATANALAGSYGVAASIATPGGTAAASFVLTNTATLPGTLAITGGSPQSTTVNSSFPTPLSVLVKDASGTPVTNATVVFIVPGAGPSANLSAGTAITDASGMASVTASANATAGSYTVAVSASSGGTAAFALTNGAGAAVAIEAVPGATPQSTQTNSFFPQPLKVHVTDAFGNGVPNVSVSFQTPQTGASAALSAGSANTDAQGFASVTALANGLAGSYFVSATAAGVLGQASFSLQNLAQAPDKIVVTGGGSQSAVVSQQFAQTLQVTVFDAQNNPLPNVAVTFAPPATGASAALSALSAVTNAQGQASVTATANTVAGTYQVVAVAEGISTSTTAIFNLTNLAGAAASIAADISGTPQSARVNTAFLAPLLVNVTDAHGNPVAGVAVSYSAPASGPSALLSAASNVTNAQGQTSITAVANGVAGGYTVTASFVSGGSATFNLTNTSGPPASIEIVSGNQQTITVGGTFAPLVVAVLDALGNRVPGQTVTFTAPIAGASAAATTGVLTTDSSGQASFTAIANTIAGRYAVAISGPGIAAPVLFALTNTAGAATRIVVVSGSPQTAVSGAPLAPLRVLVEDAFGNPVSGATVSFNAPAGGATALLSSASAITDSSGEASIGAIAGSVAGSYAVNAGAAGATGTASFSLTNVASSSGTITATAGTTQSTPVSTAFALPLTARAVDPAGNPVPGVTVTFTVPSSGPSATLSSNAPVTDSQGNVTVIATASSLAGSYQVTATAAGFTGTAVFNLQNTPVTPGQPIINAIVNAASFFGGAAPRSLQTIFGSNLATTTATATIVPLPTTLGGVTVTIGSTQVPLLYVSPTQINFQLPTGLSTGNAVVTVNPSPTSSASAPLEVDLAAPGIFLQINGDSTRAAAANTDGSTNGPSNPTPAGGFLQMFLTGVNPVSPQIPAGQVAPLTPLSHLQASLSATIGSRAATVQFAGAAPLMVIDQVNLQIPIDLPPGDYPVVISINGVPSNAAVIRVGPAGPSLQQ